MKPEVSIVIINYNTLHLTRKCIESIYAYTSGVKFEIIVVDNNSPDENVDVLLEEFPNIKLLKSVENVGFSKGNNVGVRVAEGDYILLLNSDAFLKNNAIHFSIMAMKKDPSIGVLSCQLQYPDGRIQSVCGRFPNLKQLIRETLRLNKFYSPEQRADVYLGEAFDHLSAREVDWVWGAFFLTRKEVIHKFPEEVLPEDFFMYGEDVLWCYLIKKMGFKIKYDPTGKVVHLMAGSSKSEPIYDDFTRYCHKMLPNEYDFLKRYKGLLFTKSYYFIKALLHASLRTKQDFMKAKVYASLILGRLPD